jgi:hypothetical protein
MDIPMNFTISGKTCDGITFFKSEFLSLMPKNIIARLMVIKIPQNVLY